MKFFKYSRWDGTQQPFDMEKKDILDHFMENIMKGMSPDMSLAQMMWEGFPLAGMNFRVMGLEEMIGELEWQKDELFSKYSLEKIFDKPVDDLKQLLAQEAAARRQAGKSPLPDYDQLPPGLLEKLNAFNAFDFISPQSRQIFENWHQRQKDISDLHEFYSEYAGSFTGNEHLDFEQALELMRMFQEIDRLQQQLMTGQFQEIDPDKLREMLGEEAGQSLNILIRLPGVVSEEGLAENRGGGRGFEMTPRGMRTLGESAFGKLFYQAKKDRQGKNPGSAPQSGEILPDSSRTYEYGDRFDLDLNLTILKSIPRGLRDDGGLDLDPGSFYVREREQLITTTIVVLLDLSWSMSRDGRFEAAKKVALALNHYIRTRFPKDKIHIVGFSTEAAELKGEDLATASWDAYQPFTNLQGALQLAMHLIRRSGNRNNRVLAITDGQPTAYYINGQLHVEFPETINGISKNACMATLAEVKRVTGQGMNIETFMLDSSPALLAFTRQIARINGGRAVLCRPGRLGELVLVEEIRRRQGKI